MKKLVVKNLSLAVMLGMLAGCSMIPKYERPAIPVPGTFPNVTKNAQGDSQLYGVKHMADLGWENFFHDPQLKALIPIALKNNRDMRIALARVKEAQAMYGVQSGQVLPSIGLTAEQTNQSLPTNMRPLGPLSPSATHVANAGIGFTNFELDFFGRLRSMSEAARQQYLATAEGQKLVQINLISQLASTYYLWRDLQAQQSLVKRTIQARRKTYDLVRSQFRSGVASELAVNQANLSYTEAQATLASTERSMMQAKNALQYILGQELPSDLPKASVFNQNVTLRKIPVGLSSELLLRRPDVMAAENQLIAANANIGAARAAFFPRISLTGFLGVISPALSSLFGGSPDTSTWTFKPAISVPLFNGGALMNQLKATEARRDIAVANYEKTVQGAFREVADALAGVATYDSQLKALSAQKRAAQNTLHLANLRYSDGLDSFLQVQSAQIAWFQVQQNYLQVSFEAIQNRIKLYKALGGGWTEKNFTESEMAQKG